MLHPLPLLRGGGCRWCSSRSARASALSALEALVLSGARPPMKKLFGNIGRTSNNKPDETGGGGESPLSRRPQRNAPSPIVPLTGGGGVASSSNRPAQITVPHSPPGDRGRSSQRVDHVSRAIDLHIVRIVALCTAGRYVQVAIFGLACYLVCSYEYGFPAQKDCGPNRP